MPDGPVLSTLQMVDSGSTPSVMDGRRRLDLASTKSGAASVRSSPQRDRSRFDKTSTTALSTSRGKNLGTGSKSGQDSKRSNNVAPGISKRNRASHDVDGPDTGHLPCKKRRLRHRLITSRLSQPYSLPATHILNRETGEDTPVLSRFLKFAAMGPKKAGHQTAMVRKAAILNRVRLNVRQAAVNRGHDRMWRMSDMSVMGHGLQLVTTSTGAMFPGRGSAAGMSLPRVWRPHTTGNPAGGATAAKDEPERAVATYGGVATHYTSVTLSQQQQSYPAAAQTLTTSIMTPLHHEETEDTSAFPVIEDDYRYADLSDDDMDDVYTDFGALFGGSAAKSPGDGVKDDEEEHFYEEYLDELDGIPWA
ncbi:uncharacterized protein PG998_007462 [Apiospora kogelbergensis]|uniref:Uncharacterized protein n=1 Tax=Apiospora kogelbergensis TaxID=1337665 RepID=A0AAW0QD13_9PEZI